MTKLWTWVGIASYNDWMDGRSHDSIYKDVQKVHAGASKEEMHILTRNHNSSD